MCVQIVEFISTRITEIEFQKNVLKLIHFLYPLFTYQYDTRTYDECTMYTPDDN